MFFIHKETGSRLETDNINVFSMLEREGYIKEENPEGNAEGTAIEGTTSTTEEEKAELVAKAKELGIKSAHSMKIETLKEVIAEIDTKE